MTTMGTAQDAPKTPAQEPQRADTEGKGREGDIFSRDRLMETDRLPYGNGRGRETDIEITPEDKVSFLDAVVGNTRWTRDYSLFGGKVTLTLRSITMDELNALSVWMLKKGSADSSSVVSGLYRKYLLSAQVAMVNGTANPPLEDPLFETVGPDGKTVPPGWLDRKRYWDDMSSGLFMAILQCVIDFDRRYSVLCGKAEDANFWNPDTP